MPTPDRAPGLTITWVDGSQFRAITLDVSKTERHVFEAEVTDSPVEEGIGETDNVRRKSNVVSVEGILTDYPLSLRGGGIGELAEVGRAVSIFEQLERLQAAGTRLGLDTGLKFYESMVLQLMTPVRDKSTRGALRIALVFKEIRTATTAEATVTPAERKGQQTKDDGKQPTTEATDAQKSKSWAASFIDSVTGADDAPALPSGLKKAVPQ